MNRVLQWSILSTIKVMRAQLDGLESIVTATFNEETKIQSPIEKQIDENQIIDSKLNKLLSDDDES